MRDDRRKGSKGPKTPSQPRGGREAPVPAPPKNKSRPARPDPTRYGDWEKGGRCIDF